MISVQEHLFQIMAALPVPPQTAVGVGEADGLWLAQDVVSAVDLPRFDNSAMDGYGVRSADLAAAGADAPLRLPVVADLAAGVATLPTVEPGTCVRIMTGAPVPPGVDAIVPVEATDGGSEAVEFRAPVTVGAHVRAAGDDVRAGSVVLATGSRLGPAQVGLAASVGSPTVVVTRRPRVLIVSTGSELVEPDADVGPGQIVDSNSYSLAAACRALGADVRRHRAVPDDADQLLALLDDLDDVDVVITSGGVSVGAYDVVKAALADRPAMHFQTVAMQPGKPQCFGTLDEGRVAFFGLPGNPVSALVSFEVFVRPALLYLAGAAEQLRGPVRAAMTAPLPPARDRSTYHRVRLEPAAGLEGSWTATPTSGAGSHLLAGMATANGLAILPVGSPGAATGESVDVLPLTGLLP